MRARGLKRTRVWKVIEEYKSRPMRARGLKRQLVPLYFLLTWSRPMRARGLKPSQARIAVMVY